MSKCGPYLLPGICSLKMVNKARKQPGTTTMSYRTATHDFGQGHVTFWGSFLMAILAGVLPLHCGCRHSTGYGSSQLCMRTHAMQKCVIYNWWALFMFWLPPPSSSLLGKENTCPKVPPACGCGAERIHFVQNKTLNLLSVFCYLCFAAW